MRTKSKNLPLSHNVPFAGIKICSFSLKVYFIFTQVKLPNKLISTKAVSFLVNLTAQKKVNWSKLDIYWSFQFQNFKEFLDSGNQPENSKDVLH